MHSLETCRKILAQNGFNKIQRLVRKTEKSAIFIAAKNKQKYFLKLSTNPQTFANLINEVRANQFINKIKPKTLPLYIPKSKLIKKINYVLAVFEYLPFKKFADQDKLKIIIKPSQQDLEKLFKIETFFLKIPKNKIPAYFIKKAKKSYNINKYTNKMAEYASRPMNKLITPKEFEQLIKNMKKISYRQNYQHQDFVLWNMLKHKDGKIILLDAEFARWGIKWMDLAYCFIQTYTYLHSPQLAKNMLKYFITRFKKEFPSIEIEKEIFLPLSYRITANLNEAMGKPKQEKLTRELLKKILTNNIKTLLQ